jgi:serine/threonine protein kinase/tetratricopeptide (TPR) repeat protein
MIADGKRICPACGTTLLATTLSCPVCALRTALDSTEEDPTFVIPLSGSPTRFEHYEIVIGENQEPIELGRGAMGVTYLATDTNLRCPVALKVINNQYLDDESVRQRFLTEARAAAGLRHPNVASVFHLGNVAGDYFYAMEFVEGESIARLLQTRGPLEIELALEIVNQAATALGAGYRKGLVHRDIKPANIMVVFQEDAEVTVKVIDYGLVRTADNAGPESHRFIGTPQFASPEQCAGKDADIRSDLYSLGVTLWVMLSGRLPFDGRFSEVIAKQQIQPPPFEQLDEMAEPVVSLLQSLLDKDPRKRPQTPLELRARIREVQKGLAWSAAFPRPRDKPIRPEPLRGESPYRGLQVFDVEDESIFFGRTKERDEILGTLQARSTEENKPFVLIFGASGSGKSSLLRAGVMPWLCRSGVIDGVDLWRLLLFRPSEYPGDLLDGFADALLRAGALPELAESGMATLELAAVLKKEPENIGILVKEALARAAKAEQPLRPLAPAAAGPIRPFASSIPVARLAIGLDQLEEIFTSAERFSEESRASFFKAIRALVESGYGWVVATLRSDFFSRCEEISDLVELKQGNGQYHLLPPRAAQLSQMIRYPAETAGVAFQEDPEKGRLDERIRDDALREPGGLPLLEYALDELFRMGEAQGVLSHTAYETLGGVEGALRKRAEAAFGRLDELERTALGSVLHQVVRLGSGDDETLTRRVARYESAIAQPGAKRLVDAFITARLFIADLDNRGERTLTVAHEALFRVWPEISRWEKENRDFLRVRARIGEAMARWIECDRQSDYLLVPGRPLAEAEELLKTQEASLEPDEKKYIVASRATVASRVRRRRLIVVAVITTLAIVAGTAIREWRAAVQSENRAVSARGNAEGILNYLLHQLSDKLQPIGHLDIVGDVQKQVETYYKNLGFSQDDPNALNNWATLLKAEGDRLRSQGDLEGAKAKYQQTLAIEEKLVERTPANRTWQQNLEASHNAIGMILCDQGDWTSAKEHYQAAFSIARNLANQDPNNTLSQRDLGACYGRLGNVLLSLMDFPDAKDQYQSWLEIARKLANTDQNNSLRQRDLEVVYNKLGDVLRAEGDLNGARVQFQNGLEIAQRLARQDPSNSDRQRDLMFVCERLGDLLNAQGDLNAAKAEDQAGLEVILKLVKQDPGNDVWQFDLSDSYRKVGDVLMEEGELPGAKTEYQSSLEILEKLTKHDPSNRFWQKDLSISYAKVGDVLKAGGDLSGAKTQYLDALAISQKLNRQNPAESDGQYGLAECQKELGFLLEAQGDQVGAHQYLQASFEILTDLIRLNGENPALKKELDLVRKELSGEVSINR